MSATKRIVTIVALLAFVSADAATAAEPAKMPPGQLRWLDRAGKLVLAVDAAGHVTDAAGRRVATLSDREGMYRMLIPVEGSAHRYRNDPAILRTGNRYELHIFDRPVFVIEEDGTLKVNGAPDGRVEGYDRDPLVRDRFTALLAILPMVPPVKAQEGAPPKTEDGAGDGGAPRAPAPPPPPP